MYLAQKSEKQILDLKFTTHFKSTFRESFQTLNCKGFIVWFKITCYGVLYIKLESNLDFPRNLRWSVVKASLESLRIFWFF